ncbi:MAG: radical SAM protein [Bacilli bacterium]|nr:radical SAM protein [Bacilli bacterium]
MVNLYFAIIYGCNQKCLGCPCGKNSFKGQKLSLDDIKTKIKPFIDKNERIYVTLSGGEPLLHDEIFDILDYFKENNIYTTILTNAEKLYDIKFAYELSKHIDKNRFQIITTIHSSGAETHESQNLSKGSFNKSINGLLNIHYYGIKIVIKHCITKVNYKDTSNFIKLMDELFDPSVAFELWGIDYCGLTKENALSLYVDYKELKTYLEIALDYYIETQSLYNRKLTLHNIPLCWVDPYYWNLFNLVNQNKNYNYYGDPTFNTNNVIDNAGKYSTRCKKCDVYEICSGAYKTLFEYFGDDVVSEVKKYM